MSEDLPRMRTLLDAVDLALGRVDECRGWDNVAYLLGEAYDLAVGLCAAREKKQASAGAEGS